MKLFLHRFGSKILGVLRGFDRVRLRGTLPRLANTGGLFRWLEGAGILFNDFPGYAQARTRQLREALEEKAAEAGRPVEYLHGSTNKEALVQQCRLRDGAAPGGLIAAFSTLENCVSFDVSKNPKTHRIALRRRPRK